MHWKIIYILLQNCLICQKGQSISIENTVITRYNAIRKANKEELMI